MYVGIKKTSRLGDILFFCTRTSNCKFERKKKKERTYQLCIIQPPQPRQEKNKKDKCPI